MSRMTDELTSTEPAPPAIDPSEFGVELVEAPPMHGWIVHQVVGLPSMTAGQVYWAWCRVSLDSHGYSEVHFTESDGITPADPYPVRVDGDGTPIDRERRVQLGPVLFKAFA